LAVTVPARDSKCRKRKREEEEEEEIPKGGVTEGRSERVLNSSLLQTAQEEEEEGERAKRVLRDRRIVT